jgi:hypothetical protein
MDIALSERSRRCCGVAGLDTPGSTRSIASASPQPAGPRGAQRGPRRAPAIPPCAAASSRGSPRSSITRRVWLPSGTTSTEPLANAHIHWYPCRFPYILAGLSSGSLYRTHNHCCLLHARPVGRPLLTAMLHREQRDFRFGSRRGQTRIRGPRGRHRGCKPRCQTA